MHVPTASTTRRRSWCRASGRTISGGTCRRSRRSPTPTRAPTAIRRATPASRVQGVGRLRREGDARGRIQRHDPDVQVPLLRSFVGTPTLSETSPTAHGLHAGQRLESRARATGRAGADVKPAGGIVLPPTPTPSSASGCTPADFDGFVAGKIALIQRGTCNFGVKVLNAADRGRGGRGHLQRGQPRPHRRVRRQHGRRRRQPVRRDDPGRRSRRSTSARALQPVLNAGDARRT